MCYFTVTGSAFDSAGLRLELNLGSMEEVISLRYLQGLLAVLQ